MIPKVIHYIWFGNKRLPLSAKKCIRSWKAKCPEYKIIKWDENNFDISQSKYAKKAFDLKKYAFVSDYARLAILYKYGGIYLDTDVQLLKSLDDLLNKKVFLGFEDNEYVNGAIIGCEKQNDFINLLKRKYDSVDFLDLDQSTIDTIPKTITAELLKLGLVQNGASQTINNSINVYSRDYFYSKNITTGAICLTDNTYSIHHWVASWADKKGNRRRKIDHFFYRHKNIARLCRAIKHPLATAKTLLKRLK